MEIFSFDLILRSMPLLAKGAWLTLQILLAAGVLSLVLGSCMGIMTCERLRQRFRVLPWILETFTFILRAVPFYVQLLIVYFVLPDILQIDLDAMTASIFALGVCSSGYMTQVIRCGINSIPIEQWELASTLGYTTKECVRFVILPQTLRNILPAMTNELEALLKSTAILSSIGLLELTRVGMNIVSREMEPLTIYLTLAVFYIALSGGITLAARLLERKMNYVNA
ncbi:MAG: amino acid ABC transporter permease [Parachlamydiales bacterium]|jgi:His/Glu/Gln/Arg/opine family amino acid ABC transporter permease subunit